VKEEASICRSFPAELFYLNNSKVELIKVPVRYKKRRNKPGFFMPITILELSDW
jgi:hypothetical protein